MFNSTSAFPGAGASSHSSVPSIPGNANATGAAAAIGTSQARRQTAHGNAGDPLGNATVTVL
ncbi:MAG: hypothetical protein V4787_25055, partial [Pseudomonadota bacterium]